jgi:hypothetical protein
MNNFAQPRGFIVAKLNSGDAETRENRRTEASANHFVRFSTLPLLSIFQPTPVLLCLIFLNIPSISDSDAKGAIQRLSLSQCVGTNEIPSFVI